LWNGGSKGAISVRLVLAIVSFVVAALMMSLGIAQRTVFAKPDHVDASISIDADAPITIIDGSALNAYPRTQNLDIEGSDTLFAAYGRTADVVAWATGASYNLISFDTEAMDLTSVVVPAAGIKDVIGAGGNGSSNGAANGVTGTGAGAEVAPTIALPSPVGSDLWLEEYSGETSLAMAINIPADMSMIILSDGLAPAPANIMISWPLDNSTPLAIPLMAGGGILLLAGLGFLAWAINHMRAARGPRRKQPKMPRLPKQPKFPQSRPKAVPTATRGRRTSGVTMVAVLPVLLVGSLVLSGCSTGLPTTAVAVPTPTASSAALEAAAALEAPAVTVPQAERIIAKIAATVALADTNLDATLIATRLEGPALALRLANYVMRRADAAIPAVPAIAAGTVEIVLPQQSDTWPRVVFAVMKDATDATVAPTAIMLLQDSPRSQYKVHYAVTLEPGAVIPASAPALIGTTRMGPDQKLLKIPAKELAPDYGDILTTDTASEFYPLFEAEGDSLRLAIGAAFKAKRAKEIPSTARIAFTHAAGTGEIIALSTNDAGAIVAVDLKETETVKPVEAGAAINAPASVKALLGKGMSTRGIRAVYGQQLLFYVPSAGSTDKIILLGYSQGMIAASEL
jgi:hypothetical protein